MFVIERSPVSISWFSEWEPYTVEKKSFENSHNIGSQLSRYLDVIPGKHWMLSTFYWDQMLIIKYWHWKFSLKVGSYILLR